MHYHNTRLVSATASVLDTNLEWLSLALYDDQKFSNTRKQWSTLHKSLIAEMLTDVDDVHDLLRAWLNGDALDAIDWPEHKNLHTLQREFIHKMLLHFATLPLDVWREFANMARSTGAIEDIGQFVLDTDTKDSLAVIHFTQQKQDFMSVAVQLPTSVASTRENELVTTTITLYGGLLQQFNIPYLFDYPIEFSEVFFARRPNAIELAIYLQHIIFHFTRKTVVEPPIAMAGKQLMLDALDSDATLRQVNTIVHDFKGRLSKQLGSYAFPVISASQEVSIIPGSTTTVALQGDKQALAVMDYDMKSNPTTSLAADEELVKHLNSLNTSIYWSTDGKFAGYAYGIATEMARGLFNSPMMLVPYVRTITPRVFGQISVDLNSNVLEAELLSDIKNALRATW